MKFLKSLFASLLVVGLSATVGFAGTSNDTMTVSATVSANCTLSAGTLSFGSYDPVDANSVTALDASATINVTCTDGSTADITLGQGSNPTGTSTDAAPERQMTDGSSNMLAYDIYQDSGRSVVWGNTAETDVSHTGTGSSASITAYGSVTAGQNVPSGSYSDSVVVTVTF